MALLQTLDRGLQALNTISQHSGGISVAALADSLGVHRAIAYRLVSTLEAHGLVVRNKEGWIFLGTELLVLASRFEPQLRTIAHPLLMDLAEETRATAFLSAAQGNTCVALMVAEPDAGLLRVGYRVGSRHPLDRGAAGIAILAGRPPSAVDTSEVEEARELGYSLTRGQLQAGAVGVASPVRTTRGVDAGFEGSVGVVALNDLDTATAIPAVTRCARNLADRLG